MHSVKWLDIIAALVAGMVIMVVVYPMFTTRRGSDRSPCLDTMQHLELILMAYAQDNDGALPRLDDGTVSGTWKSSLYPYVNSRSFFACRQRKPNAPIGPDGFPISYAANSAGVYTKGGPHGPFAPWANPVRVAGIQHPEWTIAILEVQNTGSPGFDIDDPFFGPKRTTLYAGHNGGGNYLFLDGHMKRMNPLDTIAADVDRKGTAINLWYGSRQPLSPNGQAILKAAASE